MLIMLARGVSSGDPKARPRDLGDERKDEDSGRTASGLSEAYRCAEGVAVRQRGAL